MKSFLSILFGLFVSWQFIDVFSQSALNGVFAPLCFGGFAVALLFWLLKRLGVRSLGYSGGDSGGLGGSGGGDSGGCGSGDGGC